MTVQNIIGIKGIYTNPNPISDVPLGAPIELVNMNVDRDGIAETRRGFYNFGSLYSSGTGTKIVGAYVYAGVVYMVDSTGALFGLDSVGARTGIAGTFLPPSGLRAPLSAEGAGNLYLATSSGVYRASSGVSLAGVEQGLDGTAAVAVPAGTGWFTNNTAVAYRICFTTTLANGTKIIGSPTSRIIVSNTSGVLKDTDVTFTLPSTLTVSNTYQIYRTLMTGAPTDEPLDEMQLVAEKNPTAGEITAKSVTYRDTTPESLLGATLYTSPSQEGILQSNDRPPLAKSMAYYKTMMAYANTQTPQRMFTTVIAIGGASGLVNGDTITIDGTVYTGQAAENSAIGQFQISAAGTPAQNIDATARSLVRVINQYATNTTVYAYYLSGYADLPGKIMIQSRNVGTSLFVAVSSRGTAFSPTIPASGVTYFSTTDTAPNRVYFSKPGQPDSVPILNYYNVGASNTAIVNILLLRDSLIALKEDGVYRISGETFADLRTTLLDGTVNTLFPHSCVQFDNKIYCVSTQGVVAVGDAGVEVVSRPIERDILQLINGVKSPVTTGVAGEAHAISYQIDRKIIFVFSLGYTSGGNPVLVYVYNPTTNAWTTWKYDGITCGVVDPTGRLVLGRTITDTYVKRERKDFLQKDCSEDDTSVTITAVSADGKTATYSGSPVLTPGMMLDAGNGVPITAVDSLAKTFTVQDTGFLFVSTKNVLTPIQTFALFGPVHGGDPVTWKKFSYVDVLLGASKANYGVVGFMNDNYNQNGGGTLGWYDGIGLWALLTEDFSGGIGIMGKNRLGDISRLEVGGFPSNYTSQYTQPPQRVFIPRDIARCKNLYVGIASYAGGARFELNGLSFGFSMSGRKTRGVASPVG